MKSEHRERQRENGGFVESFSDGCVVISEEDRIEEINEKMSNLLGYSPEEVIGKPVSFLFDRPLDTSRPQDIFPTDKEPSTFFLNTKKNRTLPVKVFFTKLDRNDETSGQTMGLVRKVLDHEASLPAPNPFRKAVEQSGHAIYITDRQGSIVYANPAFEQITGFDREEVVGRTPGILKSGEMDQEYYERLWQCLLEGEVWEEKVTNKRSDGSAYTALQTIAPLLHEESIVGFVAIQQDITNIKELQKELEEALRQKNFLLKELHHRTNNNLQVLSSLLRMQSRRSQDERVKKQLNKAQLRIQAMSTIHEILHEEDSMKETMLPQYLRELCEACVNQYDGASSNLRMNVRGFDNLNIDSGQIPTLGLLINELIMCCISCLDGESDCEIRVELQLNPENQYVLTLRVEGEDVPAFDLEEDRTLGLKLVEELSRNKLDGKLEVKKEPQGPAAKITFPRNS